MGWIKEGVLAFVFLQSLCDERRHDTVDRDSLSVPQLEALVRLERGGCVVMAVPGGVVIVRV